MWRIIVRCINRELRLRTGTNYRKNILWLPSHLTNVFTGTHSRAVTKDHRLTANILLHTFKEIINFNNNLRSSQHRIILYMIMVLSYFIKSIFNLYIHLSVGKVTLTLKHINSTPEACEFTSSLVYSLFGCIPLTVSIERHLDIYEFLLQNGKSTIYQKLIEVRNSTLLILNL